MKIRQMRMTDRKGGEVKKGRWRAEGWMVKEKKIKSKKEW